MTIYESFDDLTVLVTGSCGTVGGELVKQLVERTTARVKCIDNNETELFFQQEKYKANTRVICRLADIRDKDEILGQMA